MKSADHYAQLRYPMGYGRYNGGRSKFYSLESQVGILIILLNRKTCPVLHCNTRTQVDNEAARSDPRFSLGCMIKYKNRPESFTGVCICEMKGHLKNTHTSEGRTSVYR